MMLSTGVIYNSFFFHVTKAKESDEKKDAASTLDSAILSEDRDARPVLKQKKILTLRRLLSQAKDEFWMLVGATIALGLSTLTQLAIPQYVGRIIDAISQQDPDEGKRMLNGAVISLGVSNLHNVMKIRVDMVYVNAIYCISMSPDNQLIWCLFFVCKNDPVHGCWRTRGCPCPS